MMINFYINKILTLFNIARLNLQYKTSHEMIICNLSFPYNCNFVSFICTCNLSRRGTRHTSTDSFLIKRSRNQSRIAEWQTGFHQFSRAALNRSVLISKSSSINHNNCRNETHFICCI